MVQGVQQHHTYSKVIRRLQRAYYFSLPEEKKDVAQPLQGLDVLKKLILGISSLSTRPKLSRHTQFDRLPLKVIRSIIENLSFNEFLNVLVAAEKSPLHPILMQDVILSRHQFFSSAVDRNRYVGTLMTLRPMLQCVVTKYNRIREVKHDIHDANDCSEKSSYWIAFSFLLIGIFLLCLALTNLFPNISDKCIVISMSVLMLGAAYLLLTKESCQTNFLSQSEIDQRDHLIHDLENQLDVAENIDPAVLEYFKRISSP
ncbi:MAG: hypothetical protein SFW66_06965 [Gammaproteobacteria bacterium]|nr:hypothetical protein [Gammaproteobacteria bacterium]